jgi:hypothetical protein
MSKNEQGLCAVLGCTLPMDTYYQTGGVINFIWCKPHGMHYEMEERMWKLTKRRIERAKKKHGRGTIEEGPEDSDCPCRTTEEAK